MIAVIRVIDNWSKVSSPINLVMFLFIKWYPKLIYMPPINRDPTISYNGLGYNIVNTILEICIYLPTS